MVINGQTLHCHAPIKGMELTKIKAHGVSYGLAECGYDIRIKQSILFEPFWQRNNSPAFPPQPRISTDGEPYSMGRFCIASAIEEFDMPDNLMGIVHDKSTWARKGLSVFNTVIEPGWKGFLTLELVYHGQDVLYIPAGSGIAQVIFHEVKHPAQYEGKYQNQADEPVPSIFA